MGGDIFWKITQKKNTLNEGQNSFISEKRVSKNLEGIFEKNWHFSYSFFVIDGKIMVDIASGGI